MTDEQLVKKKLARILTCVHQLRTLADYAKFDVDVVQQGFVERTLQVAIEAALDVASHIVSEERLGEPSSNHEMFVLLARAGWVDASQVDPLKRMTGFCNVLVHEYEDVDLAIVKLVATTKLGDLEAFVRAVSARVVAEAAKGPSGV